MPPPRITKAFVTRKAEVFEDSVNRARKLYSKIVLHGYTGPNTDNVARLVHADARDVAQFIFFEIAAKFEGFAQEMFQAEVRSSLHVTIQHSPYVMGDIDNGLDMKLGWGSPQKLKERGKNLLGADSFFGRLDVNLGSGTYKTLISAHTVRNRVAHAGGRAQKAFIKLLEEDGFDASKRQGLSVGRYLRDYPDNALETQRNFFVYLDAYSTFGDRARHALP